MSVHYVLDGYNVIWSTEIFGSGRLQDQRDRFLRFLEEQRPAGSDRNRITVVFDGKRDVESPPWRGRVRVIFSHDSDADAVIKLLVDENPNPRDIVVVTDDRNIQKWVRSARAKILSCSEFLNLGGGKSSSVRGVRGRAQGLGAAQINAELKRIWNIE